MTDYYIIGRGARAYGPYKYSDAKRIAAWLAHPKGGDEKGVIVLGTVESARPSTDVYNNGEIYDEFAELFEDGKAKKPPFYDD